ncbi:putative ethyl tert-butyl ether degradation EthD [Burkholderia cepacia]|nr:putative ethyl tert-butyl ether degradation EthD [Burkholderia cepacia]
MIVCICPYFPVQTFIAASVRPGGSSCISSSPIAEPGARDSMPVTTSSNTFRWWKILEAVRARSHRRILSST